jgi:hypothetical protein
LPLSSSIVISPWIKSLTWGWKGTPFLWLPSWQPSHYAGWGVLLLKSHTTWNNNHKQPVTCIRSLSLYYIKNAFFKSVLYRSVQTYIHHQGKDIQHHNPEEKSALQSRAVRRQNFTLRLIFQLTVP